jgi:hypothetical protein
MSVSETAANVQDRVLEAVKTSQDALLSAIKAVADKTAPLTGKLPSSPFAEKLLASQKAFTTELLDVYGPAKSATKSA